MRKIVLGIILIMILSIGIGFMLCMMYTVKRSKAINNHTRDILQSAETREELALVKGRMEVMDELLVILSFKKFK